MDSIFVSRHDDSLRLLNTPQISEFYEYRRD